MKKILIMVMCFLMQPAFSAVQQSASPVEISAEMLNTKYAAYEVKCTNMGSNPVKISSIDVANMANNANQYLVSAALSDIKKNNKYIHLSIVTLGISGIVGNAKNSTVLNKQKAALAEAATFETNLEHLKNEIIMPGKTKSLRILVPAGETPTVEGLFQDTVTNKYLDVEL